MKCEASYLQSVMRSISKSTVGAREYIKGILGNTEVVLSVCGVGKVFAGVCAHTMIVDFGCTHIINIGVAGSLSESVVIGDIVSASVTVQHDMDTSAVGDPVGLISGLDIIELECDKAFADDISKFFAQQGKPLKTGIVASGDKFIKKTPDKIRICERFGACAAEMEGGAIGQICIANKIPYNVLRIITDNANEDSGSDYSFNLEESAVSLAKLFSQYIQSL